MGGFETTYINGSKVVLSVAGRGTGDLLYVTADGRCWRNLQPGEANRIGTGETLGAIETRKEPNP